ncbi:unnamed protein product [Allacma fusca]|uniref:Uncharacterized protein n=1 Tax=Allacma fusca TaxID=39272 RepID=A0A8J2NZK8_9HEXA|nr:unnamed protein product [Allacma fusca]
MTCRRKFYGKGYLQILLFSLSPKPIEKKSPRTPSSGHNSFSVLTFQVSVHSKGNRLSYTLWRITVSEFIPLGDITLHNNKRLEADGIISRIIIIYHTSTFSEHSAIVKSLEIDLKGKRCSIDLTPLKYFPLETHSINGQELRVEFLVRAVLVYRVRLKTFACWRRDNDAGGKAPSVVHTIGGEPNNELPFGA